MTLPNHIADREYRKFKQTHADETSVRVSDENETLNIGGVISSVTLNATTWTALPTIAFPYRKTISVQNQSSGQVKLNYNPSTPGYVGVAIPKDGERVYNLSPAVMIYGKCASGTATVIVEEVG